MNVGAVFVYLVFGWVLCVCVCPGLRGAIIGLTNRPVMLRDKGGQLISVPLAFPETRLTAPFRNKRHGDATIMVTDEAASTALSFVQIAQSNRLSVQRVLAAPFSAGYIFHQAIYDDAAGGRLYGVASLSEFSQQSPKSVVVSIDPHTSSVLSEYRMPDEGSVNTMAIVELPSAETNVRGALAICLGIHHPSAEHRGQLQLLDVSEGTGVIVLGSTLCTFDDPVECVTQYQSKFLVVGCGRTVHLVKWNPPVDGCVRAAVVAKCTHFSPVTMIQPTGLGFAAGQDGDGVTSYRVDESVDPPQLVPQLRELASRQSVSFVAVGHPDDDDVHRFWCADRHGTFYSLAGPVTDRATTVEDSAAFDLGEPLAGLVRARLTSGGAHDALTPLVVVSKSGAVSELLPIPEELHSVLQSIEHWMTTSNRTYQGPRRPLLGMRISTNHSQK